MRDPATAPRRPSDALNAALGAMNLEDLGTTRLNSFPVLLLMALREIGWDVVPRSGSQP